MPERYIGKTLGKYRIDELIGSGGFAWVYRGFDPELEIPVALKVLKPQFAGDPTFEERFRREASTAAKLRHPGIIKIYAVGRDHDAVYFVMDFLPSGLADKLETSVTLPEEFVVRVGMDVARALGFAHREGVIHRDIKVDNILFDSHGNAVVADFGIARAVTGYANQTGTNMVVGTPQYFAPEQARAKPLDGRADIYSLGVSLYRAITGRLPFEGDDWYEIARQHVEDPPPAPRNFNAAISPAFERLLIRCLAKHPDDRPATGEQLADELASVLVTAPDGTSVRGAFTSHSDTPTLVTPVTGIRSPSRTTSFGTPRSLPFVVAGVMAVAIATAFVMRGSASARKSESPDSPVATTGSLQLPATAKPVPIDSTTTATDSVIGDPAVLPTSPVVQPPRRDSVARPPIVRLSVAAPPSARIFLNRAPVSEGPWRTDTLKAGDYTVAASVPAPAGCETARVDERVHLRAGTPLTITLQPRSCGTLQITARNVNAVARYTIVGDGNVKREGSLPLASPLVLPVGTYTLRVLQAQCAPYEESDVKIEADAPTTKIVMLLCGS
ncbi:MAG: serine/threonine-protein kinase [Gemmatimonadaceae bacterium]